MKRVAYKTALLLMLAAGSLALPCAAQQEVMPDIYDATARTTAPAAKTAKPMAKANVRRASQKKNARRHTASTHLMLAKSQPKPAIK